VIEFHARQIACVAADVGESEAPLQRHVRRLLTMAVADHTLERSRQPSACPRRGTAYTGDASRASRLVVSGEFDLPVRRRA
jgi:hypothetical protein